MQEIKQNPIGIFDSGLGGLSVLRSIREQLPGESLWYVADTAHIPYGDKSAAFILERSRRITAFLQANGAKAIVVACNTATAAAIHQLRDEFSIPIIGMEPGIKPALQMTRSGVVGVLATQSTLASDKFKLLLSRFHTEARFIIQPCPGLVELVERGEQETEQARSLLDSYLKPLLDAQADTIVLGCTHYPFLSKTISSLTEHKVHLIDTGPAVAAQLHRQLEAHDLFSTATCAQHRYFSSAANSQLQDIIGVLTGGEVKLEGLPDIKPDLHSDEVVA